MRLFAGVVCHAAVLVADIGGRGLLQVRLSKLAWVLAFIRTLSLLKQHIRSLEGVHDGVVLFLKVLFVLQFDLELVNPI